MDESTLNDLLECSVCLERLTDSKVLPCQHTFCKKCLEVIVASQKELRCPECRVIVDSKIEDLPPNVLLMRILEGLKNSANHTIQSQNSNVETSTTSETNKIDSTFSGQIQSHSNFQKTNLLAANPLNNPNLIQNSLKCSSNQIRLNQQHQMSPQIRQNNSSGVQNIPKAFALHTFQSKEVGDLHFNKGDVILIKKRIDTNWLCGTLNGREGAFPVNYVQIIVPLPVPQCIALYDFKMGPNEEEGCLTFKKGTVINVLRRVDHNWAEGRISSNIGIFPIAFAEMNSLAKQVLQQQPPESSCQPGSKPKNSRFPHLSHIPRSLPPLPAVETNLSDSTTSSSSSSALMSPNSTCSSSSNSVSSSPINQSQSRNLENTNVNIRHRNANKEKRNSLNSLTANKSLSIAQSNRHSAEILSVPHDSANTSLDQSALPTRNDISLPCNSNNSVLTSQNETDNDETKNVGQVYRANVLKQQSNMPPSLPWCYMALYPYKPKKNDELELKKGCVYIVTERCLDGWFKGKNWLEKSGVFPGNYVAPLRSRDHQQLMHQKQKQGNENIQPINHCSSVTASSSILPDLPPRIQNNSIPFVNNIWSKTEKSLNQLESTGKQHSSVSTETSEQKKNHNPANESKDISQNKLSNQLLASTSSSVTNLMKRLTHMKRSKSPTAQNAAEDLKAKTNNGSSNISSAVTHPVHVRSGSCPSQLLQTGPIDLAKENIGSITKNDSGFFGSQRIKGQKERPHLQTISGTTSNKSINEGPSVVVSSNPPFTVNMIQHRKTQSLDATCKINQLTVNNSIKTSNREGRFRCIVSYPPNSEFELELNVGDIVFVHRKQKNGWYKGTHSKTNKTGLFPASFVEPML